MWEFFIHFLKNQFFFWSGGESVSPSFRSTCVSWRPWNDFRRGGTQFEKHCSMLSIRSYRIYKLSKSSCLSNTLISLFSINYVLKIYFCCRYNKSDNYVPFTFCLKLTFDKSLSTFKCLTISINKLL